MFLDEPTTGLDLQTRIVIWSLLQKLQKKQGLTIFLTTHYLEEAENADQMYILKNGNVLANGSAKDIKIKYAPNKLLLNLNKNQKLVTTFPIIEKDHGIEIDGIDSKEAIALLDTNQEKIKSLEYRQGSIDDAFIKITGKELQ